MRLRLVVIVVLAMLVLVTVQVVGADSIADHVVISEVYPNPEAVGDACEFIELYNPTDMIAK